MKRKGRRREARSEGSVEQRCEPMDKNGTLLSGFGVVRLGPGRGAKEAWCAGRVGDAGCVARRQSRQRALQSGREPVPDFASNAAPVLP